MTGHLLGAAGAVESIATVLALHDRLAPPTINLEDLDDEVHLDVVRGEPRGAARRRPIVALNNSFGFGGHNVALVVQERRAVTRHRRRPKAVVEPADDPRNPLARLAALFDDGTRRADHARGRLAACSPAIGLIDGTPAVAFCSDATIQGGAMGEAGCEVDPGRVRARARRRRARSIGLWHSGGARLREGVVSLHAVGRVFAIMTRASGKIPQISVVLGPAAGGAAYGPALTDVVILGPEGRVFVTGPDVVRSVTGEDVDALRLGGPEPHGRRCGVVHVVADTQEDAYAEARRLAALLGDQGDRSARSRTPTSRRSCPSPPSAPTTCTRSWTRLLDDGQRARAAPQVGAEHHHDAGPARRPHRRRHREQPAAPRRLPRLVVGGEGRAVRADVRRVRRAAGRRRRRARLPARRRPGVGRRRPPRRQAAARVRRGGRAAGDAGDPQGVRRRVHRDELPLARCDPGLRLAGRRGRRHGRGRGGAHPAPAPAGRGGRATCAARSRQSSPSSTSSSPAGWPGPWRSASSTRSSSRARPGQRSPPAIAAAPAVRGDHGNIPL